MFVSYHGNSYYIRGFGTLGSSGQGVRALHVDIILPHSLVEYLAMMPKLKHSAILKLRKYICSMKTAMDNLQ